jgi:hypothetical protein
MFKTAVGAAGAPSFTRIWERGAARLSRCKTDTRRGSWESVLRITRSALDARIGPC